MKAKSSLPRHWPGRATLTPCIPTTTRSPRRARCMGRVRALEPSGLTATAQSISGLVHLGQLGVLAVLSVDPVHLQPFEQAAQGGLSRARHLDADVALVPAGGTDVEVEDLVAGPCLHDDVQDLDQYQGVEHVAVEADHFAVARARGVEGGHGAIVALVGAGFPLSCCAVAGPVALVGSGEYLPVMAELEASLIAGRPPRYVQFPTAAGLEGEASVSRWVSLGRQQAARLGVEAVPVMALDRASADDEANACLVEGAGLIYLSGGDPGYLAATLRSTRVWRAVVEEWSKGAALAGCSAGAMALMQWVPDIRRHRAEPSEGLGLVPAMWALPHFDRLQSWAPDMATALLERLPAGSVLVGLEEETAIVSDGEGFDRWAVHGRQSAWLLGLGFSARYRAGVWLDVW